MINRIIFLEESPFTLKKYKSCGVALLEDRGFRVEIWDLTPVLHREFHQQYTLPHQLDYKELRIFHDQSEAYQALSDLSPSDFLINNISYLFWNLGVYRALSTSRAKYAVSYANAVPIYRGSRTSMLKKRLKLFITFKRPSSKFLILWKKMFMRLPFRWLGVKPASLILAGGDKCFMYRYPVDQTTEILKIHSFDYDLYLQEKGNPNVTKPMAVFIDEFLPFSHDRLFEGREGIMSADKYYPLLNKFFDRIEGEIGLEVVIAANPRSNYEDMPNYFNGRKCLRGQTMALIRESRLVLAHRSTAVSFANLYRKPVIFMSCSDLDKTFDGRQIRQMAQCFGKKPIFMDKVNGIDWTTVAAVDENAYDHYRRAYIKSDLSPEAPFWQIVADRFKKGF